jgi:predicted negative regulator of RcsB-dependent stress response
VGAKIAASEGNAEAALALLEELDTMPPTYQAWMGFAFADRAEVHARLGDTEQARRNLDEARRSFERKGATAAAGRLAQVEALL